MDRIEPNEPNAPTGVPRAGNEVPPPPPHKKTDIRREIWEWTKALVMAFAIVFLVHRFIAIPIVVDGQSMMPTLKNGERMIVNRVEYAVSEPDRFDIVVFHAPEKKDYIKRVIGLPGDMVEYKDDLLYINGKPIEEPYLGELKQQTKTGPLTGDFKLAKKVPEGSLFVLGDNRQHSQDSRYIGPVDVEQVVGTASFVFWPLGEAGFVN